MENWKDVKGFEGIYRVSDQGNVKSLKFGKERILKQNTGSKPYLKVGLSKNGKAKTHEVHVLVAIAFLDHTPCGMDLVVDHVDLNKQNNNVENLQIITQRENANRKHLKSSSQYTGVYWHKATKKWMARIGIKGEDKYLGLFTDEIEASNAYQKALSNLNPIK